MEAVFAEFVVFGNFLVDGVGADVGGDLVKGCQWGCCCGLGKKRLAYCAVVG